MQECYRKVREARKVVMGCGDAVCGVHASKERPERRMLGYECWEGQKESVGCIPVPAQGGGKKVRRVCIYNFREAWERGTMVHACVMCSGRKVLMGKCVYGVQEGWKRGHRLVVSARRPTKDSMGCSVCLCLCVHAWRPGNKGMGHMHVCGCRKAGKEDAERLHLCKGSKARIECMGCMSLYACLHMNMCTNAGRIGEGDVTTYNLLEIIKVGRDTNTYFHMFSLHYMHIIQLYRYFMDTNISKTILYNVV